MLYLSLLILGPDSFFVFTVPRPPVDLVFLELPKTAHTGGHAMLTVSLVNGVTADTEILADVVYWITNALPFRPFIIPHGRLG
jgi:hypothetical protein